MKNALFTLAEVNPACAAQCLDLIRHIEHGDASAFKVKAQELISKVLDSDPIMTTSQHAILTAAVADYHQPEIPITIFGILAAHNLTQTSLAKRFGIPLRTIQSWCTSERKAPEYVLRMINEILDHDKNA